MSALTSIESLILERRLAAPTGAGELAAEIVRTVEQRSDHRRVLADLVEALEDAAAAVESGDLDAYELARSRCLAAHQDAVDLLGGHPICTVVEDGRRCHQEVIARGWCRMHYERWRRHGDPMVVVKGGRKAKAVDA